ncbi:hypothetical protein EYR41_004746 [Orbilia oligospora]|uniref:Uncharacterized protein n=1 Tax=Orbilia oligospora TaxID=2813651 RepID=A0A8H2E109_ORBOL|nr:hypothetical protein EYR41_004746 [Orbilia oligospora]
MQTIIRAGLRHRSGSRRLLCGLVNRGCADDYPGQSDRPTISKSIRWKPLRIRGLSTHTEKSSTEASSGLAEYGLTLNIVWQLRTPLGCSIATAAGRDSSDKRAHVTG